jgi:hypothetical protein
MSWCRSIDGSPVAFAALAVSLDGDQTLGGKPAQLVENKGGVTRAEIRHGWDQGGAG